MHVVGPESQSSHYWPLSPRDMERLTAITHSLQLTHSAGCVLRDLYIVTLVLCFESTKPYPLWPWRPAARTNAIITTTSSRRGTLKHRRLRRLRSRTGEQLDEWRVKNMLLLDWWLAVRLLDPSLTYITQWTHSRWASTRPRSINDYSHLLWYP